jgi:putative lipoic acid-binding regulatory protein
MSKAALLEFPTDFPIKALGRSDSEVVRAALAIVAKHAGPIGREQVHERKSADGNFVSVTIVVHATSQVQLDTIYRELSACSSVLMSL